MNQKTHNGEIDLFDVVFTLWKGKFIIAAFVVIGTLCGLFFFNVKDKNYSAHLYYFNSTMPSFLPRARAEAEFKQLFFSRDTYRAWREQNADAEMSYNDFNLTYIVDGFEVLKAPFATAARFVSVKGTKSLLVKTNSLSLLEEYYSYLQHVNSALTADYIQRAKNELRLIESRFGDLSGHSDALFNQVIKIELYVSDAERGATIFEIQPSSRPALLGPKKQVVLFLSSIFGGLFGVALVLITSAMRKRGVKLEN